MNDLYTLTRKLMARGCPEHPRLTPTEKREGAPLIWVLSSSVGGQWFRPVDEADARALWTIHALEWALEQDRDGSIGDMLAGTFTDRVTPIRQSLRNLLSDIEAATRHLEPK